MLSLMSLALASFALTGGAQLVQLSTSALRARVGHQRKVLHQTKRRRVRLARWLINIVSLRVSTDLRSRIALSLSEFARQKRRYRE
jgi:hypothetical protein